MSSSTARRWSQAGAGARAEPGSDAGRLEFRVLGPLEVLANGRRVVVGGARQRTVLAMLLLEPDRVISVDRLIHAVWNGHPPATSRTQIAICVASLRKMLSNVGCTEDVIVTAAPGYRLVAGPHRIDALAFTEGVEAAQQLVHQGRTAEAAERLHAALSLWRGTALNDVSSGVLETEASLLERQRLAAYEQYATLQLELGKHHEIVPELSILVQEQPLWEHARASLMLAHYRSGRRYEALQLYHEARKVFEAELGLEPSRMLQDLHVAILRESLELQPATPQGRTPAVAAAETSCPPDVLDFVGRDAEMAALDTLPGCPRPDDSPAVAVITGRAGVGKTTLAVHWARRVADRFPDGRLFAEFDERIPDDEQVAAVCAGFLRALGVPDPEIPVDLAGRLTLFHAVVATRRCLIVLDGVRDSAQVQALMPRGRDCGVLMTSRKVLAEPAHVRLRVPPLREREALRLLGALVTDGRVAENDIAVSRLAQLCDHLPLALAAAAERLAVKPHWKVSHLLSRLLDAPHRLDELSAGKRNVRTVLDRAYHDLGARAAAMYRKLSLLSGCEVSIWAGQALLDVDATTAEAIMEDLVDVSVLDVVGRDSDGVIRYRLSGLTKLHALERAELEDSGADRQAARQRLADAWRPGLRTAGPPTVG